MEGQGTWEGDMGRKRGKAKGWLFLGGGGEEGAVEQVNVNDRQLTKGMGKRFSHKKGQT